MSDPYYIDIFIFQSILNISCVKKEILSKEVYSLNS